MLRFALAVVLAVAGCAAGNTGREPEPTPDQDGGAGGQGGETPGGGTGGGGEGGQGGGTGGESGSGGSGGTVDTPDANTSDLEPEVDAAPPRVIVSCKVQGDCATGFCVDGYCCDTTCGNPCTACNVAGFEGLCAWVPKDVPDVSGRVVCAGTDACDGEGACKKRRGETCDKPEECVSGFCTEGYCCDSACTEACKSCAIAASPGKCTGLPVDATDSLATIPCEAPAKCGVGGICLRELGKACATAAGCQSAFCVDGVCCNTKCDAMCYSCDVTGKVGTCSPIEAKPDSSSCPAPAACELGTCRQPINSDCTRTDGCSSYLSCCAGKCIYASSCMCATNPGRCVAPQSYCCPEGSGTYAKRNTCQVDATACI